MQANCPICDKVFKTKPCRFTANQTGVYCSRSCRNKARIIPAEERFWKFVEKGTECWLWTGRTSLSGYGMFDKGYAHIFSYELHYGKVPKGLFVLHSCPGGDQPLCVRPEHIRAATQRDNIADAMERGSFDYRKNGIRKLTRDQVDEIRAFHAAEKLPLIKSSKLLAPKYEVKPGTIRSILVFKTWK